MPLRSQPQASCFGVEVAGFSGLKWCKGWGVEGLRDFDCFLTYLWNFSEATLWLAQSRLRTLEPLAPHPDLKFQVQITTVACLVFETTLLSTWTARKFPGFQGSSGLLTSFWAQWSKSFTRGPLQAGRWKPEPNAKPPNTEKTGGIPARQVNQLREMGLGGFFDDTGPTLCGLLFWGFLVSRPMWGFPKIGVPLLGVPFQGVLFYLGYKRGTPILGNTHVARQPSIANANNFAVTAKRARPERPPNCEPAFGRAALVLATGLGRFG